MIGSINTGKGSADTGQGSAPTAGVESDCDCTMLVPTLPGMAASIDTGLQSVNTAADTDCDCTPTPPVVDCDSGSLQFDFANLTGTDVFNSPPPFGATVIRAIPVDGTKICSETTGPGKLKFDFIAGELFYGEIGSVGVTVGINNSDPFEGTQVYFSQSFPDGVNWRSIASSPNEGSTDQFNNPNPTGTFYIKLIGTIGAGTQDGFRHYELQITVV